MPGPPGQNPQWQRLPHLCAGTFDDAFKRILALECKLVLITTGSEWPPILRQLGLPHLDVCRFFSADALGAIDRRHKTALSHDEMYFNFVDCCWDDLWRARDAVLDLLGFDATSSNAASGTTFILVISCQHGLHRSQAVARSVGSCVARRGHATCVFNYAVFSRQWCVQ